MCIDTNKVQRILPCSYDEEYLISLALKHKLTGKSSVKKQHICLADVNRTLMNLTEINQFFGNVTLNEEWADGSEQSDPELWKLLTDNNAENEKHGNKTDSDDDIEDNNSNTDQSNCFSII